MLCIMSFIFPHFQGSPVKIKIKRIILRKYKIIEPCVRGRSPFMWENVAQMYKGQQ